MNIPIIDTHSHVYPDKIALKASKAIGEFYGCGIACDGTVSQLLERGKMAGITTHVISSVATTPHQVSSINRFMAQVQSEHPGKIIALGALHPDSDDIKGDIEMILELGLHGIKMHPDTQGFCIDDPRCMKIYELAAGKLPVLLHTGDKRYDYSNPNRLIPILKEFEDMTVIGAHFGGWSIWEDATEKLAEYRNLYVDCSSSLPWISKETAVRLIRTWGSDRVMFGVDYPMWDPKDELDRFLSLELTEEERHNILYKTASGLYHIEQIQ